MKILLSITCLYILLWILLTLNVISITLLPCSFSSYISIGIIERKWIKSGKFLDFESFQESFLRRHFWLYYLWLLEATITLYLMMVGLHTIIDNGFYHNNGVLPQRGRVGGKKKVVRPFAQIKESKTFFDLFTVIRPTGSQISKMFPVPQVWKGISSKLQKLILLIYGRSSLVSVRSRTLFSFVCFLLKIYKAHGSTYSIKWMKCCFVALQRYCGDNRVSSLRDLEPEIPFPRMINGLPFIIPKGDRKKIQRSHKPTIQFWLSVFSIYRICKSEYSVKLSSITDPFNGNSDNLAHIETFIDSRLFSNYFKNLNNYDNWVKAQNLYPSKLSFIQSASPTNNVSWHGLLTDLILIKYHGHLDTLEKYLNIVGKRYIDSVFNSAMTLLETFYPYLQNEWNSLPHTKVKLDQGNWVMDGNIMAPWVPCRKHGNFSGMIGQLSFKEEAAGKLRVFAMVDFWTQNILKPLHEELFKLLHLIPNDGTFDQDASVKRGIEKSRTAGKAYSFDLSSATDRLPISIQWRIINMIFPKYQIGELWKALLVDRDYYVPDYSEVGDKDRITHVRYSVGQPMGAYSSWAMLAITHHWILQYSAFLLGRRGWESNYEILGDDLVIFDSDLANVYLSVAKDLGVEINLSKSIVSPTRPSFEFAKRMIVDTVNVSAISFKQLISESSMAARVNNFIYYARMGLIRNVTVLKTVISRFGFKSNKDLNFPLISLLGYCLNSQALTLKDILKTLVNPKDDEWSLDSPVSLPYQSLYVSLKGFAKSLETGEKWEFILPSEEDRMERAEEEETLLSDMIVLHALSEAKLIERNFEQWRRSLSGQLFGSFPIKEILKRPEIMLDPSEWIIDLIDNFEGFDPTTLVDDIEKIAIKQAKVHHLDVNAALALLDKVEAQRRRWSIGTVKARREEMANEKSSPIFRYILENAGRRSNLSYLRERPTFGYYS